jgi:hypothetical protein
MREKWGIDWTRVRIPGQTAGTQTLKNQFHHGLRDRDDPRRAAFSGYG